MSKFTLKTFILSALTSSALLITPAFSADSTEITNPIQQTILYVNINTDSLETLADLLSGIGEKKAQAIIDYRELNGHFKTADELLNVKGIGVKTLERNREAIKVEVLEVSSL
ncbi:MAG: ComEA family DNA-binding protein [Saccharospirillaceae bacterium]|nr:ComEA family DNA-binding protein [Saccharospirillaceae bacterium]